MSPVPVPLPAPVPTLALALTPTQFFTAHFTTNDTRQRPSLRSPRLYVFWAFCCIRRGLVTYVFYHDKGAYVFITMFGPRARSPKRTSRLFKVLLFGLRRQFRAGATPRTAVRQVSNPKGTLRAVLYNWDVLFYIEWSCCHSSTGSGSPPGLGSC